MSPTNKQFNEPTKHDYRPPTLSAKKHKLPPLASSTDSSSQFTSNNQSTKDRSQSNATDLNSSSSSHFPNDHFLNREVSNISTNSSVLPKAFSSKKAPLKKMSNVENNQSNVGARRIANMRNFDTAVTIDILNESDRFSRQSLEPLTNRESTSSKFSSVSVILVIC